MLIKGRKKKH